MRVPRGQQRITFSLTTRADDAIQGTVDLSLERLGIAPIKGPLGAFRVSDGIGCFSSLRGLEAIIPRRGAAFCIAAWLLVRDAA